MNKEELSIILKGHKNWLNGKGGSRADLRYANLTDADLRHAGLRCADLRHADLRHANLSGANLSGASLDYSCIPLWCGSLNAHFDDEQLKQIAYHLVFAGLKSKNASEETKKQLIKLKDFANSARVIKRYNLMKIEEENN